MKEPDVIIVGAGAAGLMCAIETRKRRRRVVVLDHANKPGKKILMSGGGRCNFTNLDVTPEKFISHNKHFCRSALSRYTPIDFIKLVNKHRIPFHEKTLGQLFCDNKSKDILEMLLTECQKAKAEIKLKVSIEKITKTESGFKLKTTDGVYQCKSVVIASGGLSIPTMGASPFGYKVAEQFGIKVWPTRAGLVPFTLHDHDKDTLSDLSGVSVECDASCNKQMFHENMLFTHRGLSGPAMLQISSYWTPGDALSVDLYPQADVFELLKEVREQHPKITLQNYLNTLLPKRLVETWLDGDVRTLADCGNKDFQKIAQRINQWKIKPNNTEGYRTAEVTLGGVDCNAVSSKTFEANNTPGLFFIGEVLDVTGWLGGYNFQWAWASGHACGQFV